MTAAALGGVPGAGGLGPGGRAPARPASPVWAARWAARVAGKEELGGLVWLTLDAPGWPVARPGQFALLQARNSRCFLGRALSVAQEEHDAVSFLIAPIGVGTRELCALEKGADVWLLGPLGNGFDMRAITAGPGRLIVVGGGVGVAPFPLLLSRLVEAGRSAAGCSGVLVLLGFRDNVQAAGARPVIAAAARLPAAKIPVTVRVVSEDGRLGRAEKVTETLEREMTAGDHLAVCGPGAMVTSVVRLCREVEDVEAWFSLEAGMACGVGSCHGCAIALADGSMARVCREGPVFSLAALVGGRVGTAVDGGST